jgi:hypothetical protein
MGDLPVIGCRAEARLLRLPNLVGEDAHNVRTALVQGVHFARLDIEAGYAEALAAEEQRQRQPHVPHPDNADRGLTGLHLLLQVGQLTPGFRRHSLNSSAKTRTGLWIDPP